MYLQVSPNRWGRGGRLGAAAAASSAAGAGAGDGLGDGEALGPTTPASCGVSFSVTLEEHTVATFGATQQEAYCAATAKALGVIPSQVF